MCVYDCGVFTAFLVRSDVVFKVGNVQDVMHHRTVTGEEEAGPDRLLLETVPVCWLSSVQWVSDG